MIAFLTGTLASRDLDRVVLNVGGIGYEIFVTERELEKLTEIGTEATLHTHMHVREDAMTLFGFSVSAERALFARLLRVSGVGPKVALAILTQGSPAQLAHAVLTDELAFFTSAPGIGKRTAERLLVELRGTVEGFASAGDVAGAAGAKRSAHKDAVAALTQLGYSEKEAEQAVHASPSGKDARTEDLVRDALKQIAAPAA